MLVAFKLKTLESVDRENCSANKYRYGNGLHLPDKSKFNPYMKHNEAIKSGLTPQTQTIIPCNSVAMFWACMLQNDLLIRIKCAIHAYRFMY